MTSAAGAASRPSRSVTYQTAMAQRISRAKQRVKAADAAFSMLPEPERAERLRAVQHVLYLIFSTRATPRPQAPTCSAVT
jgi:predicted RNA polymerase sigma factor